MSESVECGGLSVDVGWILCMEMGRSLRWGVRGMLGTSVVFGFDPVV